MNGSAVDRAKSFDLLIVGAGMVGASLLCALLPVIREQGLKVAVVEAFALPESYSPDQYQLSYDARSTALSWGSSNILRKIGVWDQLRSAVTPIERIHVSDKGHFGSVRIKAADYGVEALGYVVENAWMGQVLLDQIKQQGVTFLCPAQVVELLPGSDVTQIVIEEQGKQLRIDAQLVVIADGGRSGLSEKMGMLVDKHDYQQQAIIANVTAQQPHNNVAYERFTSEGPIAMLPLYEHKEDQVAQSRCALVLTVDRSGVDDLMALSDSDFLEQLQQRFGFRLGRFLKVGERYAYPLSLRWAKDQFRPGLVVVGNAAHTLHPVAGQGFNLALRGVADLAALLGEAAQMGRPLGSADVLRQYSKLRQQDQEKTIRFTDGSVRLFSNNDLLLSRLRDFGLVTLDLLPVTKRLFAQQAMGFGQSALARTDWKN